MAAVFLTVLFKELGERSFSRDAGRTVIERSFVASVYAGAGAYNPWRPGRWR